MRLRFGLRKATSEEQDQLMEQENAQIADLYYLRMLYEEGRTIEMVYTNTTPIMYIRVMQRALSDKTVIVYRYFRIWTAEMVECPPNSKLDWRLEGF